MFALPRPPAGRPDRNATSRLIVYGLVFTGLSALTTPASLAQSKTPNDPERAKSRTEISPVVVTAARPVDRPLSATLSPAKLSLDRDALDWQAAPSLGETLIGLPGVQNSSFGPAAGRPEIRGQGGPRVALLVNGLLSRDGSVLSGDHATPLDPILAERIEVIKGPAAVLYGGSAISGAVNVIDNRIPTRPITQAPKGKMEIALGLNQPASVIAKLEGGNGSFAWHADASFRQAGDLDIPASSKDPACQNWGDLSKSVPVQTLCQVKLGPQTWVWDAKAKLWIDMTPPEKQIIKDQNPAKHGTLPHSQLTTRTLSLGGSYFFSKGFIGAAVQHHTSDYGVPGFAYITYAHPTASPIDLSLRHTRLDVQGRLNLDQWGLEKLELRLAHSQNQDREIIDQRDFSRLTTTASDYRLDLSHQALGPLSGGFGSSGSWQQLSTTGDKAYLPSVATRELGLYVYEALSLGPITIRAGYRHDNIDYNVNEATIRPGRGVGAMAKDRHFSTNNASAQVRYDIYGGLYAEIGYDHAERAPALIELYGNGEHFAILTDEQGDARLRPETARNVQAELGWQGQDGLLIAQAYHTDYDDYLYLGNTGISRTLPVREWRQGDALIEGFELKGEYRFTLQSLGQFTLSGFADKVTSRAKYTLPVGYSPFDWDKATPNLTAQYFRKALDGDFLYRTPASRLGLGANWRFKTWRADLQVIKSFDQDKLAKGETKTKGYVLVNAQISKEVQWEDQTFEVFLQATNLLDEDIRAHNSYLKYRAPQAGRGLRTGIRFSF